MIPGVWPFWTPGARLANAMKRTTRHCYILNIYAVGFTPSEKIFFKSNYVYVSSWSLIGRIFVGDHKTLLHTKYITYGPHGFSEDFLKLFPF